MTSLFSAPYGTPALWWLVLGSWAVGFVIVALLLKLPSKLQAPIVLISTFLAGTYWIVYWLWPTPPPIEPGSSVVTGAHPFVYLLQDSVPVVNTISNVLAQLLLGLGVFSILRMHLGRILRKQKDWEFSVLLLVSMILMVAFGYWDWLTANTSGSSLGSASWKFQQYGRDLLFDGMLQQMDAAMFSLIAFFIFSAAYRAFRIRSVESSVMLVTAILIMLSLMGLLEYASNNWIGKLTNDDPNHILNNLRLVDVSEWVRNYIERPSIRGLEFGLGVGGLAIALRIWLGLDKRGAGL
jgi:hypothetical protein